MKDRGIDRAPQVHLGPAHAALLRRGAADKDGVAQKRADYNKAIKQQTPPAERTDEPRTSAGSYQVKSPAAPSQTPRKIDLTGPSAGYYERKKARQAAAQAAQEYKDQDRSSAADTVTTTPAEVVYTPPPKKIAPWDKPKDIFERRKREHEAAMQAARTKVKPSGEQDQSQER